MVPLVAVDRASVPGGELVLFRRGSEFAIRVRGIELMNSRNHGSEDELGTRTGQLVAGLPAPQVLIGGLGFGYTLRAALDVLPEEPLPRDSRIMRFGDRVLLSPHMVAANQGGTLGAAIPWAAEAALAALRGELPERIYNTEAVAKWQARFGGKSLLGARRG